MAPIPSFPLMKLPHELVRKVVLTTLEPWSLHVQHDEFLGEFEVFGAPSCDILLVCKEFFNMVNDPDTGKDERKELFSGILTLSANPDAAKSAFEDEWKGLKQNLSWVFEKVTTIKYSGEPWALHSRFYNLERIEADNSFQPEWKADADWNEVVDDLPRLYDRLAEQITNTDTRVQTRGKWGLSHNDFCTLYSPFRLRYGDANGWFAAIYGDFAMTRNNTTILSFVCTPHLYVPAPWTQTGD